MNIKNKIIIVLVQLLLITSSRVNTAENTPQNCIILLDHNNWENVGRPESWFLITRLQSAIAEQTTPILLNITLWNSFIERRTSFEQKLQEKDSLSHQTYDLYSAINERMEYWSKYYNTQSGDVCQNKKLVVQNINKEFYANKHNVTDESFQLLLNYCTTFDPQDWDIYKNTSGFYLFVPKKYADHHPLGFKTDSLEKVAYPEDSPAICFDTYNRTSMINTLSDFFIPDEERRPSSWNIVLAGHGGSIYKESNSNQTISWIGKPLIADLDTQEFKEVLDFFQSNVKTHFFHYSSCYAGGNHISLLFNNEPKKTYNFAISCDTLTDCTSYCKWSNLLPSDQTKFLKTTDLTYDSTKNCWQLPLTPAYRWKDFFKGLATIDFSFASIESLQEILTFITHPIIANTSLLCLPGTHEFFPLQSSDMIKIDDRLVATAEKESAIISIQGVNTVLVESSSIEPTIILDQIDPLRIISIKPDNAIHYIRKLKALHHLDLPSTFWQAQFQCYDKTFLIEECEFPYSEDSEVFIEPLSDRSSIVLKNVIVSQQKSHYIRVFFTFNDKAMVVVANKPGQAEHKDKTTIQEVLILTSRARKSYEKHYFLLKKHLFDTIS